ncbi:hypothetical protein MZO42_15700 [Sphingomonas psychrotolerans]|uniref:HNH endonuclease n=1 Tax=Sphingomonas psychrotolerans TaxID=1327635 RepID=A0ABU3N9S5_9SPHN|nr:hypothetical protein [Sphingomonas psychrotolerans]MDT8760145.1 hypothetical protein [Sphingomonas psychrotolerans]
MINANMFELPVTGQNRRAAKSWAKDELAHFEICPMCSQAVDRRNIFAVMHHLPVGHQPLPVH